MDALRILLVAPFRTDLNLDTARVSLDPCQLKQDISALCSTLKGRLPGAITLRSWTSEDQTGPLKYASLAEDNLPPCSKPFLVLESTSGGAPDPRERSPKIESCHIELYDNTIGILRLVVEVPRHDSKDRLRTPEEIDHLTTKFCGEVLVEHATGIDYVHRVVEDLADGKAGYSFLTRRKFEIFAQPSRRSGGVVQLSPLWVTRVLLLSGNQADLCGKDYLEAWTQSKISDSGSPSAANTKIHFSKAYAHFFVGNSVLLGDLSAGEALALESSVSISNYFYAIADIVNCNLSEMISRSRLAKESARIAMARHHESTCSHLDYMESIYRDLWLGLQGYRKRIAVALFSCWEYDLLRASIASKRSILAREIESAFENRRARSARVIEVILASIGGVALLDFCVNLYSYVHGADSTPDTIAGLSDVPASVSMDLSLYVLIAAIIAVGIAVLRKGR